eukprot:NODE_671_length_5354_cov_0.091722.p5 type:complete len:115 gc:universal NODE_671_length_5354_cov_0.091722:1722-1378(-)
MTEMMELFILKSAIGLGPLWSKYNTLFTPNADSLFAISYPMRARPIIPITLFLRPVPTNSLNNENILKLRSLQVTCCTELSNLRVVIKIRAIATSESLKISGICPTLILLSLQY